MDILVGLLILLAVLAVGGTAAVVARGAGLWSPPALPDWVSPRRPQPRKPPSRPGTPPVKEAVNGPETVSPPVAPAPAKAPAGTGGERVVSESVAPSELARLEERVERQAELLLARLDELGRAVAAQREEANARQDAADARHEAALERLRADLTAAIAAAEER